MKKKIYMVAILIPLLLLSAVPAFAADNQTIEEESIYYIVVDRFNNAESANDFAVDLSNPTSYHGETSKE